MHEMKICTLVIKQPCTLSLREDETFPSTNAKPGGNAKQFKYNPL